MKSIPITTIRDYMAGGLSTPGTWVVGSRQEHERLSPSALMEEAKVDFEKDIVLFVFAGKQLNFEESKRGYMLHIVSASLDDDGVLVVGVKQSRLPADAHFMNNPYHVVVVPRENIRTVTFKHVEL